MRVAARAVCLACAATILLFQTQPTVAGAMSATTPVFAQDQPADGAAGDGRTPPTTTTASSRGYGVDILIVIVVVGAALFVLCRSSRRT